MDLPVQEHLLKVSTITHMALAHHHSTNRLSLVVKQYGIAVAEILCS